MYAINFNQIVLIRPYLLIRSTDFAHLFLYFVAFVREEGPIKIDFVQLKLSLFKDRQKDRHFFKSDLASEGDHRRSLLRDSISYKRKSEGTMTS